MLIEQICAALARAFAHEGHSRDSFQGEQAEEGQACWRVIWVLWTVLSSALHWKSFSLCRELVVSAWVMELHTFALTWCFPWNWLHAENCCQCREMGGRNCMPGRCFSAAIIRNRKVKMPPLPVWWLVGRIGPKSNTKLFCKCPIFKNENKKSHYSHRGYALRAGYPAVLKCVWSGRGRDSI